MGSKDEGRDETEAVAATEESAVDDPQAPREDDAAKERSTSPVPRVGDTWESMDPRNEEQTGPQRRVGVLEIDGDQVHVENKVTRRKSHIAIERFTPPYWRFIG